MTMQTPLVLGPDDGLHLNFLNTRSTVKLDGDRTGGAMTAIECLAPRGWGPPLHRHDVEDEVFHVMEGRLWVSCDGHEEVLDVGGMVWLPKGLAHQFQAVAEDGPTKFLQLTLPAQFEHMAAQLGVPQDHAGLPQPVEVDPEEVARVCAAFDIEILGPPPAPLD